jgi:predicted nucleic acid-binding protein
MASEVFLDTSGFFVLIDERDPLHRKAADWMRSRRGQIRPVTTEWVIGETCTLLIARKRPHMVPRFLDYIERSSALLLINPDDALLHSAKAIIRRQAAQGFSFVDCISFCVMAERKLIEALTTDAHFQKAGFSAVLT